MEPMASTQEALLRLSSHPDRDSADESWSAVDSENDRPGRNGSSGSHGLKRKRPLTVSCVWPFTSLSGRFP